MRKEYANQKSRAFKKEIIAKAQDLNGKPGAGNLQKPLNQLEQQVVHSLFAIGEFCDMAREVLAKRGACIPNSRQRIGLIQWASRSLFENVIQQLDRASADRFVRNTQHMRIRVAPEGIGRLPPQSRMVWDDDLCDMAEAAWRGTCMMCGKHGVEAKKCPLKKAFDHTMLLNANDNQECWYKEI